MMMCSNPEELALLIQKIFSEEKAQVKFRCNGGVSAHEVLKKGQVRLQSACPELPWKQIQEVADEVYYSDLAIELGTSCQDYVFETAKNAIALSALASQKDCKGTIDLSRCIRFVVCEKVGRQSRTCEGPF